MKNILCVHLYNDYSGSPLVLSTAIKGLKKEGHTITLLSSDTEGFLSKLPVNKVTIPYQFHASKWMRLLLLLVSQYTVFLHVLKNRKNIDVIYINTILPFGAAIAGKILGKKIIYHVHETSIRPLLFMQFLKLIVYLTATKSIYVSKYLKEKERMSRKSGLVIYNALSTGFVKTAIKHLRREDMHSVPFTVLMLCSLKKYKGVDQFVQIAKRLPHCQFELVLNATMPDIKNYFDVERLPDNLVLFPKQNDVHWFYQRAHLVLNLSDPTAWVETFGMTILEGMTYGIPVIAPEVGGPIELVKNGVNGYTINSNKIDKIVSVISDISSQNKKYKSLSKQALLTAERFQEAYFHQQINRLVSFHQTIDSLEEILPQSISASAINA